MVWKALLALVVSLALQVGVNYANDYSDGIRGTDTVRVGPFRLVGSGLGGARGGQARGVRRLRRGRGDRPRARGDDILVAARGRCSGDRGGLVLHRRLAPYGYAGLGELFVFVFFGLVAVCGTTYVQVGRVTAQSVLVAVPVGFLACAILVANNLRDIPTDAASGKRTLAVRLGDARTRLLYAVLLLAPFVVPLVLAAQRHRWCLLALAAAPLVLRPLGRVRGGALGRDLVPVLRDTGRLQLGYAVLLGIGLALS